MQDFLRSAPLQESYAVFITRFYPICFRPLFPFSKKKKEKGKKNLDLGPERPLDFGLGALWSIAAKLSE
jgi:hypothetical protein